MLLNEIGNVGKERFETIEIDSVGLRSHDLVSEHNLTCGPDSNVSRCHLEGQGSLARLNDRNGAKTVNSDCAQ